ncbi:MAG: hypothetical protein NC908_00615 [Candidatus Omnitrophica bacterium]|nr:hypothetical protein [Candidatus Omnitrophota bacterium]
MSQGKMIPPGSKVALILLGIALLTSATAFTKDLKEHDIEANATVDKDSILIGDKFRYCLVVKTRKNMEVELPQVLLQDLSIFAVRDFGTSQKEFLGKKIIKRWYLLDTYASGEHTIPAPVIKYRPLGSADWRELRLNEPKVKVKSILEAQPNQTDIRDIRGPQSFKTVFWFYVVLVSMLIVTLGVIFGFIFFKKKNRVEQIPPVPAHIIAYKALAALEKKDYIKNGQLKAYYTELSDIVRHYLESRFNIRAPEMTTEEFLVKIKQNDTLSVKHKDILRDFLSTSDLVKFAKYQPAQTEADLSMILAKKLIDETKELTEPQDNL